MTIIDFQDHIDQSTLQKGLDYFRRNKVSELSEFNGYWDAYVQGREQYLVNVSLLGKFITHTHCDCRVFNHEGHCKHVVAVICSIYDRLFHPVEFGTYDEAKTTVTPYIISLLNSLSTEDLRLFVLKSMHEDDYLSQDLVTFTEEAIDNAAVAKHVAVINAAFSHVANIEDHDSGEPGSLSARPAAKLLAQARKLYQQADVTAAMDIAFAVLSKKQSFESCEEDESGGYEQQVADAFNLLDEICSNTELDEYNTRRMIRRSMAAFTFQEIEINRYKIHWLDLLLRHGWDEEKKDHVLELLDIFIKKAKKEEDNTAHKRFADAKEAIIAGTNRIEKVIKTAAPVTPSAEQGLSILPARSVPKIAVSKEGKKAAPVSEKKLAYLKTKAELISALEKEKAAGKKTTYHALQKELMAIMHQNSDVFGVREMGNRFYEETGDSFFYESVKSTYMISEWEKLIASKKE